MVTARPIPILSDNYAWLLRDEATGATAIVDPAEVDPVVAAIDGAGGMLDAILLTHHHADHIAGTDAIRDRYGARVIGGRADHARLPALDQAVGEGDTVMLGSAEASVLDTPGHTRAHISFFFPDGPVLLCGDTLFSLGCGRIGESDAATLYASLRKLAALPPETFVCCGHEYTESNARFALHVDPANPALQQAAERVRAQRAAGKPSVPSRLADELAANPFLRAPDAETFAALRAQKDSF